MVSCSVPDVDVNISLPDLSSVPADMQVTLVDEDAGTSIYARTMSGYTYRSAGAQSTRNFRLVVSPRDVGSLAITMTTASARSGSMVMTYSISKNARVTARVLNIAGRPVRTLCADRMTTAGVQTLNWELNNDAGARVPAGMYLLQVEAVAENGQQARAITQLNVGR